ncbi:MAG: hypothetical protein M1816_008115 [Peltula sp. TS41687]|nr:MAG: hypothetical protein M1816_008115 [Peltula sp. TS41687]
MPHRLKARDGFDLRGEVNMDTLSWVYLYICFIWTGLLVLGVIAMMVLRNLTFIRMRNVGLAVCSVGLIHVYVALDLIRYTMNGMYPCLFEYWIMSTYFPIGIALFQAQNVQLLDLNCIQRQIYDLKGNALPRRVPRGQRPRRGFASLWQSWRQMNLVSRTYVCIGAGVILQVLVSVSVYLVSRKFYKYGITSEYISPAHCRQGWEWLPSALWQGIWTWCYGPWVLYKIRHIHEIHYWKLQTTLSIVCGLPGLPLIIAAIYSDKFAVVNKYFPPSMWFAPGLMMMEFVTVFFPLLAAGKVRWQKRLVMKELDEWEKNHRFTGSADSTTLNQTIASEPTTEDKREKYTRQSLELTLAGDTTRLLEFAATKDFSGENIIFLTLVRDWKRDWDFAGGRDGMSYRARCHLFNRAQDIFFDTVCIETAKYPINLEWKLYAPLRAMFSLGNASKPMESATDIGQYATNIFALDRPPHVYELGAPSVHSLVARSDEGRYTRSVDVQLHDIPSMFDGDLFNRSEESIKYLVFTNTWRKFVNAREEAEAALVEAASLQTSQHSRPSSKRPKLLSSSNKPKLRWLLGL